MSIRAIAAVLRVFAMLTLIAERTVPRILAAAVLFLIPESYPENEWNVLLIVRRKENGELKYQTRSFPQLQSR